MSLQDEEKDKNKKGKKRLANSFFTHSKEDVRNIKHDD